MEQLTQQNMNKFVEYLAKTTKTERNGDVIYVDVNEEKEKEIFQNIKNNSFLGVINFIKVNNMQGNCLGLNLPMPSTTDTLNNQRRDPEKAYISPMQEFKCSQINVDAFVGFEKLDAFTQSEINFNQNLDRFLDKQVLFSLLLAGFNGAERASTSDPKTNLLAEDVAVGWLAKIKQNAANSVIKSAEVGENKAYKNLNALVKAGLQKIPNPLRARGNIIAICGRNLVNENAVSLNFNDLDDMNKPVMLQKTIGGLNAIYCPAFPENSILITSLDNLSLYAQAGTVRRILVSNPRKNRYDIFSSLSVDFIVEDYNNVALIENIALDA